MTFIHVFCFQTMFNLENFEQELQWCVDQLQLGLERQNPDSKQGRYRRYLIFLCEMESISLNEHPKHIFSLP